MTGVAHQVELMMAVTVGRVDDNLGPGAERRRVPVSRGICRRHAEQVGDEGADFSASGENTIACFPVITRWSWAPPRLPWPAGAAARGVSGHQGARSSVTRAHEPRHGLTPASTAHGRENDVAEAACCLAPPPDLVRPATTQVLARCAGVIRARGAELARRGEKSSGGFYGFTRCSPRQHADFALAA
jgi:hypothetical protein